MLERHSPDYVRHGGRDLFAARDVRVGTVIGALHPQHRSTEFRHFLDTVERNTRTMLGLYLILDNARTYKSL